MLYTLYFILYTSRSFILYTLPEMVSRSFTRLSLAVKLGIAVSRLVPDNDSQLPYTILLYYACLVPDNDGQLPLAVAGAVGARASPLR